MTENLPTNSDSSDHGNSDESPTPRVNRLRGYETRQGFDKIVNRWSHASVYGRHFDPFRDIPWDDPAYAVDPHDERWILGPNDNLGAHEWYQGLGQDEKIRVGLFRYAHSVKVGSQFEMQLNAGIMHRAMELPNGIGEEFRYPLHEVGEEVNHIQMFQKFVDLTGVKTHGAPAWFRNTVPYITPLANKFPIALWMLALGGEEPVDHMQRSLLKEENQHPLLHRIMEIHTIEELRHIGFAQTYMRHNVPKMSKSQKETASVAFPVMLRKVADVIMRPSSEAQKQMNIPKKVVKEIWWDSAEGREFLANLFPDARKLAAEVGLKSPEQDADSPAQLKKTLAMRLGDRAWRAMGIDGQH
jgi:hypothetical protein